MASLTEKHEVATTQGFRDRVQIAMIQAANDILNEDPATEGHAVRVSLANSVIQDPKIRIDAFSLSVALNDAIADAETKTAGSSPDADIVARIAALWNSYAGL